MLLQTVFRCCTLFFLVKLGICKTSSSEADGNVLDVPGPEANKDSQLQKIRYELKGPEVDGNDETVSKNGDNKDGNDEDDDGKDADNKDGNDEDDDGKDGDDKEDDDKDDDDKDENDKGDDAQSKEDKEKRLADKTDKSHATFDLTKESASKFVQVSQMSAMPGFSFSPTEMVKFHIWPQGAIPFYIDEFSYDKILRDKIREYLDVTNSLTGLRFLEIARPPEDDTSRWVFFINRRGQLNCTDYSPSSFTYKGVQKVVIGYDCLGSGREMAAIVLALAGVPPQHNSPDRNTFIQVNMKSIQPGMKSSSAYIRPTAGYRPPLIMRGIGQLIPTRAQCGLGTSHTSLNYFADVCRFPHDVFLHRKCSWKISNSIPSPSDVYISDKIKLFTPVSPQQWLFYDIKYDFKSAGHYPSHKYTTDGSATIVAKNKNNEPIGEAEGFSYADVKKIRMLYNFIILQNVKNVKLPECKILYRPSNNFKIKPLKPTALNARKKPQKYVAAAKSANEEIFDGTVMDKNEKENNDDLKKNEDGETQKLKTKEAKPDPLNIKEHSSSDERQKLKERAKKKVDPLKMKETNLSD